MKEQQNVVTNQTSIRTLVARLTGCSHGAFTAVSWSLFSVTVCADPQRQLNFMLWIHSKPTTRLFWIQSGFMVDPFGLMNNWTGHNPDKRM